jgi:hypothetical protein
MSDGEDTVYVGLNRGDVAGNVGGMPTKGRDLLTDSVLDGPTVSIPPRSARVIVVE